MTIEVTGKKVPDAIEQGLRQLGVSLDEVNVEVIDAGGFLRKAKVRLTVEEKAPSVPEKSDSTDKADKPAAKTEKADKPEEKPEKTDKPEVKVEKSAKSEKAAKPEKSEKTEAKSEKAKKPQKPAAKTEKADKPEVTPEAKPEKADKSAVKPDKAKKPEITPEVESDAVAEDDGNAAPDKKRRRERKRRLNADELAAAERAKEFVEKTVALMGFEGVTVEFAGDDHEVISITAKEGDDSLIIGRHGETLSSLTYLAETCAIAEKCRVGVVVDCNGYRARRAASLTAMARRRAHECAAKQRRIKLEAMDRIDRRTVHMALADDAYVDTESEGKEPYRCVVLVPKAGVRPERKERERDRGGRGDRRDRREKSSGGAPQKRAAFNVNLHGFVGHNDAAGKEEEARSDADATPDNE